MFVSFEYSRLKSINSLLTVHFGSTSTSWFIGTAVSRANEALDETITKATCQRCSWDLASRRAITLMVAIILVLFGRDECKDAFDGTCSESLSRRLDEWPVTGESLGVAIKVPGIRRRRRGISGRGVVTSPEWKSIGPPAVLRCPRVRVNVFVLWPFIAFNRGKVLIESKFVLLSSFEVPSPQRFFFKTIFQKEMERRI